MQPADGGGVPDPVRGEPADGVRGTRAGVAVGPGQPLQVRRPRRAAGGCAAAAAAAAGARPGAGTCRRRPSRRRRRGRRSRRRIRAPQRHQGGRESAGLVGPAVHQLQQLHRELDVAQAAGAELELAVAIGLRDVVLDPAAHRLHVVDERLALRRRPHSGPGDVHELGSDVEVAGGGPGLEQRLELPGVGPLLVVGPVPGRGPDQRPGLAVRSQRGVDLPGRLAADPHQPGRQGGGGGEHRGLGSSPSGASVGTSGVVGDEDHVDVGEVVQFHGAALAHGDDAEPGRGGGRREFGGRHGQRGLQRGVGQVGQRPADRPDPGALSDGSTADARSAAAISISRSR